MSVVSAETDVAPIRRVAMILAVSFMMGAAVGVLFTVIAQLQDTFDLTNAQVGQISGVSFISTMVSTLIFGPIADRGHERWLMIGGVALAAAALISIAVGSTFWVFFLARVFQGVGYGMYAPAARRVVALTMPNRSGQAMGWMAGAEISGVIGGPAIGALIADAWGLDAPFLLFAVVLIGLAPGLYRYRIRPEAIAVSGHLVTDAGSTGSVLDHRVRDLITNRKVVGALVLSLAIYLPVGLYDSLWARFLTDRGAGPVFIGFSLLFFGLPVALLSGRGGRLADTRSPLLVAHCGAALIIAATATYGWMQRPAIVGLMGVIEGIGQSGMGPAVSAILITVCPRERISTGQALGLALNQLGAAAGAFWGPQVYGALGGGPMFSFAALLMAAMWLIGTFLVGRLPGRNPVGDGPTIDAVLA